MTRIVGRMIELSDARQHVLDRIAPLDPVVVEVGDALGMVLAGDVAAVASVPPFANTAMDGVALRSADLVVDPVTDELRALLLTGTVAAGVPADAPVGPGEAMRIMTGAPIPDGADAVVMVELCRFDRDELGVERVTVGENVPVGNHIRPVGDDVSAGDVVLLAGDVVTAGGIGLLRTLGLHEVLVIRRPRVGVMSTGDELVEPPAELGPGQIYDSNRAALLALVRESGCEAVDLGLVADDAALIEATLLRAAAECDAVLSSGGVSMGDFDLVKQVLDDIGDMAWMQIAIRPAKPFAFGLISVGDRSVPVFGLPGNPVSSLVSFELLARPGLRRMAGHSAVFRPATTVMAGERFGRRADGKTHFARVIVSAPEVTSARDGVPRLPVARSAGGQGSHQLGAMALANGFAVLPDGDGVDEGEPLDVLLFDELR